MSFSLDLRVFPDQQPTDVGEEEASSRIMRISIGFGVLVMHPMIAGPVNYGILGRNKVEIFIYDEMQNKIKKMFELI